MSYIIADHIRLADLHRIDTSADTPAEAQAKAAEMAKRYG